MNRARKKQIRVAMITPSFPIDKNKITGGIEGVSCYLVNAFKQIPQVTIEVIVPVFNQNEISSENCSGTIVHFIPVPLGSGGVGLSHAIGTTAKYLWRWINRQSYDLVHIHAVAFWQRNETIPCVVTVHGIGERDLLYRGNIFSKYIRWFLIRMSEGRSRRKIQNVIAINPWVKNYLALDKQQVWDIPNPIADTFFSIQSEAKGNSVLCVSSVIKLKNITGLIRAFALVVNSIPNAELSIAGSFLQQEYRLRCCGLVKDLGLSGKVNFLGALSISQLQDELSRTRCLALCSFQETAPLAISEAMAAGVPVVVSNICGIPHMVEDGETGFLFEPKSHGEIAKAIITIISLDDEKWEVMSSKAKKAACANNSAFLVAQKTANVYREILELKK